MYNDQLVYIKVVIWAFFGISLWTEKVALNQLTITYRILSTDYICISKRKWVKTTLS